MNMDRKVSAAIGVILVVVLGLLALSVVWQNQSGKPAANQIGTSPKLSVVASFYPLYFFAAQIAGDKASVYNVTPAAAEPHDYEPTTQDIAKIEDSQLLILNGGKLEAWGDSVKNTLQGTKTAVITVGDAFANREVVEDGVSIRDPHVWLDPPLAKKEAAAIAQGLERIDPADMGTFEANLAALNSKLDTLDQEYRTGLSSCQKKDIITSHAAFGYLAADYGLNQVPISGLSPDAEPSPAKLAEITDFAKKNHVTTIFFESLVSPKLAETIASETGAQAMVLNPIEGLTDQELGDGKTYLTEMANNLDHLKIALQCQ